VSDTGDNDAELSLTTGGNKDDPDAKQKSQTNHKSGVTRICVALIEAVSKLFWPAVVVYALFTFERPIYNAINTASGGGATVEVAGLKIILPKSAVPPPPDSIKAILPSLDAEEIEFIIGTGKASAEEYCWTPEDMTNNLSENSVYSRLKKSDMISISSTTACTGGTRVAFKPLLNTTRGYLADILKGTIFSTGATTK
jgi:hypothetical protein